MINNLSSFISHADVKPSKLACFNAVHTNSVMSVIQLMDGRICSGSWDKTIRVWNAVSGVCEKVLQGHTNSVMSVIQLMDGRICSGSGDSTIRVW